MSFDAKSGILKAINETNDPAMKTVLLLMLGVFEEIGDKIDNVLTNEQALRATVLNGHEPVHHKHHEWLEKRMAVDEEVRVLSSWVRVKMQEEKDHQASRRKVGESIVIEVFKWLLVGGMGALAGKFIA